MVSETVGLRFLCFSPDEVTGAIATVPKRDGSGAIRRFRIPPP